MRSKVRRLERERYRCEDSLEDSVPGAVSVPQRNLFPGTSTSRIVQTEALLQMVVGEEESNESGLLLRKINGGPLLLRILHVELGRGENCPSRVQRIAARRQGVRDGR